MSNNSYVNPFGSKKSSYYPQSYSTIIAPSKMPIIPSSAPVANNNNNNNTRNLANENNTTSHRYRDSTATQPPLPPLVSNHSRDIIEGEEDIEILENSSNNPKKITLQVSKVNGNRGNFNTVITTPGPGVFPTLHSLQTKINEVAQTSNVNEYDLYYRYGANKTKTLLTADSFEDIDWNDERLSFNITEKPISKKRSAPDKSENEKKDDNAPANKRSRFDKLNNAKQEAEQELHLKLPIDLQNQMSHADYVSMACLMAGNPSLWTVEKIESHLRSKIIPAKKNGPNNSVASGVESNSNVTEATITLQSQVLKLQEKVNNLELVVQRIQSHFGI